MDEQQVTPGTEEFDKMVFKLSDDVNDDYIQALSYNGNDLEEIQKGIYAMPAYVDDNFNLFFIVSQLVADDWIVAFAEATIENENEVSDFSDPLPTGEALNLLGRHSPDDANQLLKYFETLADAGRGEWRLIQ